MFGNPSPLVTPYNYSKPNSDLSKWYSQNPQEVELMMKQKFQQATPPPSYGYSSDPYSELQNELSNCSPTVRNRIFSDEEYKACDANCEILVKQAIEEVFIPQILNTPKGRIEMERFVAVVKNLKEKYSLEESKTNEQLQLLLNDEVVRQRMQQLSQVPNQATQGKFAQRGDKS